MEGRHDDLHARQLQDLASGLRNSGDLSNLNTLKKCRDTGWPISDAVCARYRAAVEALDRFSAQTANERQRLEQHQGTACSAAEMARMLDRKL